MISPENQSLFQKALLATNPPLRLMFYYVFQMLMAYSSMHYYGLDGKRIPFVAQGLIKIMQRDTNIK